ncbi:MAG TPA: phosphatase PAP2 family protein [Bacteroidales bacterium]|nr:phosphatase PAP2 family protein [Bacteroidales bacterium]
MIEQLDRQLLLILNSANSPFWDDVMFFVSMKLVWIPLYLAILIYLAREYRKSFLLLVLCLILSVVLADQLSNLIKDLTARPRPSHETSIQGLVHTVNGYVGGAFGFVSSHAANSFNVALFSLLLIRRKWYSAFILLWAATVSYSRIYLGVHYPGDIICGAVLGILTGWVSYSLFRYYENRIFLRRRR